MGAFMKALMETFMEAFIMRLAPASALQENFDRLGSSLSSGRGSGAG